MKDKSIQRIHQQVERILQMATSANSADRADFVVWSQFRPDETASEAWEGRVDFSPTGEPNRFEVAIQRPLERAASWSPEDRSWLTKIYSFNKNYGRIEVRTERKDNRGGCYRPVVEIVMTNPRGTENYQRKWLSPVAG